MSNPFADEFARWRSAALLCRMEASRLCISRGHRAELLWLARRCKRLAEVAQAWAWGEHWFGVELGEEFGEVGV